MFYEIGLAYGLDKRVLLFATDLHQKLPFDVEHHYIIRSPLSNSDATKRTTSLSKPLGNRSAQFLDRLKEFSTSGSARPLEELVYDLLQACTVDVMAESKEKDIGADFAVWSDELEPIMGNPLIVEVKRSLSRNTDIAKTGKQIAKYLKNASGIWGLLLYQNGFEADHPSWTQLPPTLSPFGWMN